MAEWSAIAETKVSYTNDVTSFSAARRLKFSEDPSQPTGLPTQLSDVIWDPSLEVIRSSSFIEVAKRHRHAGIDDVPHL